MKFDLNISRMIERSSAFFSFIIGLGVAALLFHRKFNIRKTLAMPLEEVESKTVKSDGKCYKYRVEDATCEIVSSM
jgi:hypothetical protein